MLNYVQEVRSTYSGVFWIDASNRDAVEREFGYLYRILFKLPSQKDQDLPKIDVLILLVRDWFVQRAEKFLLVFDGADNIENTEDPSYVNLNNFIPQGGSVDVIVTTRISTARHFGSFSVEVHEMEKDEASTLLCKSSRLVQEQMTQSQQDEVERIVGELGCLALAVNLAGSYISNTPRTLKDLSQYLPEYWERRQHLLNIKPSRLLHQYDQSVLSILEVSFEAVTCQSSIAANLLIFLAFLDGADIFPELFDVIGEKSAIRENGEERAGRWEDAICRERVLTSYDIEGAFSILRSFSMIRWIPDQAAFSMHKLVHAWGHDRLGNNEQIAMTRATAQFLEKRLLCDLGSKKDRCSAHLVANFNILSHVASRSNFAEIDRVCLFTLPSYADFFGALGQWSNEAKVERYISGLASENLGPDHPYTISAMSNYAITLRNQGELDGAAKITKEVLEKRTRILGAEHPDTILAISNYASTLEKQGELGQALEMKKEVLEKMTRILGAEHPDTIKNY